MIIVPFMQHEAILKVALIEREFQAYQMNNTFDIENHPGYANISGPDLLKMV